jgi:hypothetical protein
VIFDRRSLSEAGGFVLGDGQPGRDFLPSAQTRMVAGLLVATLLVGVALVAAQPPARRCRRGGRRWSGRSISRLDLIE